MRIKLHHKLIALTVTLMLGVVVSLATYLSSRQIESMRQTLRHKAATYGEVMAAAVHSAVAFSDRETAREALHSLDKDPDVASVVLLGANGEVLFQRGTVELRVRPTDPDRIVETSSRVAVVTNVATPEGPRGMIVIELSTQTLKDASEQVVRAALADGALALACGAIVAWLFARRLARRMRAMADVATAVAGGDLSQQPIDDSGRDEVGVLARAFNAMLGQIRQLLAHVRELAREEQTRLEALVAERTAQLDRRNLELRLVFDQVEQGLMIVGRDGTIASDRSAAVERWLGPVPASAMLGDYVRSFAPEAADWIELQWDSLRDGHLPPEICLAQLPSRFEVAGRYLELAYQTISDALGEVRVLVVVTDETARVERERAERDEREVSSLVARLLRGRVGFLGFHAEAARYVAEIAEGPSGTHAFMRTVHTLKGISALEGIHSSADLCHELETVIADGDEIKTTSQRRVIAARWKMLVSKLEPLIDTTADRADVLATDLARFDSAIARQADRTVLAAIVRSWRNERVTARLERLAEDAQLLAVRLGKDPVDVRIEADETLRLPNARWAPFWSTLVHSVRNAVDHGLESPAARAAAGKPGAGVITLRALRRDAEIVVEVQDSGRGIDWTRVAGAALAQGLPASTHRELVDAIFADGVSTCDTITETSGRGVGMAALRSACEASGGRVEVASTAGVGTTVAFTWPESAAESELVVVRHAS